VEVTQPPNAWNGATFIIGGEWVSATGGDDDDLSLDLASARFTAALRTKKVSMV
jgi:hypothetical protein